MKWDLLAWILICLGIELLLQSWIRQQLFTVSYRLTSNAGCALSLFAFFMFPGTLLHEGGHLAAALLLGSRISRVSLKPQYEESEGIIELGSVVAKDVGTFRNSIISIAPTVVGGALILAIGWFVFDFPTVVAAVETGMWDQAVRCLTSPFSTIWGWIGAYAIVVTSMHMLPSPVDVRSAVGLIVLLVILLVVYVVSYLVQGAVLDAIMKVTNLFLGWLGLVLAFTIILSVPVFFILKVLTHTRQ